MYYIHILIIFLYITIVTWVPPGSTAPRWSNHVPRPPFETSKGGSFKGMFTSIDT